MANTQVLGEFKAQVLCNDSSHNIDRRSYVAGEQKGTLFPT